MKINLKTAYILLFNVVLLNLGILPATLAESKSPTSEDSININSVNTNSVNTDSTKKEKSQTVLSEIKSLDPQLQGFARGFQKFGFLHILLSISDHAASSRCGRSNLLQRRNWIRCRDAESVCL